ncbi:hypothetical protein [Robertkochia solimangrovi]|uniref:hypothetical protein n=1 Tax=Robertkochia solimangrovi TaxID=2213046 RepID=UPI001180E3EE|nr:hypothetical protein [Robertkochia solimangrovi]TRZ46213.1 hypothetical protein DMZ48_02860 [Robertkochia solimangrovi]
MKNQNSAKERIVRSTKVLALWTFSWVASVALASFGPKFLWNGNKIITALAIIINLILGVMMVIAHRNHLSHLDELQRKLHMDAMGISLGVAVVGGLAYSLMDTSNLIPGDAEISTVVMLVGISYLVTLVINQKRYS